MLNVLGSFQITLKTDPLGPETCIEEAESREARKHSTCPKISPHIHVAATLLTFCVERRGLKMQTDDHLFKTLQSRTGRDKLRVPTSVPSRHAYHG